jgi:hypothetical protein
MCGETQFSDTIALHVTYRTTKQTNSSTARRLDLLNVEVTEKISAARYQM